MDEFIGHIPRIIHEFAFVSKDLNTLEESVDALLSSLQSSSHSKTHHALNSLLNLDTIKSRMEASRDALKEAESWSTLTSELNAIFASRDLERAGLRLRDASRSLVLLEGTPDYEERKNMLSELQNQLQIEMTSKLRSALLERDSEQCKKYYTIFEQIDKESEFLKLYYTVRLQTISDSWANTQTLIPLSDQITNIPIYLNEILIFIRKEQQ